MNNPNLTTWICPKTTCPSKTRSANCKPAGCHGETLDRRELNAHARKEQALNAAEAVEWK